MDVPFDQRLSDSSKESSQPAVQPPASQRVLRELQQLERDLKRFLRSPSTSGRELTCLERAVDSLALHPDDYREIATSRELRCYIGMVLGSEDLSSSSDYNLQGLSRVLGSYKQVLHDLFSRPNLAATLGAVIMAPTDYREFAQDRDALALELVSQKLKQVLGPKGFLRWQSSAATSLLWGYEGVLESPSPILYAKSTQLRRHAYDLQAGGEKARFVSLFEGLVRQGEPIPQVLWEIFSDKARREISTQLGLDAVITWMGGQLDNIALDIKRVKAQCDVLPARYEVIEGPFSHEAASHERRLCGIQSDFVRGLERLREVSRVFALYFEGLCQGRSGPQHAPSGQSFARPVETGHELVGGAVDITATLREEVQDRLGASLVEVMQPVCECLAQTRVPLAFPHSLARELTQLLDETGMTLDSSGGALEDCSPSEHECFFRQQLIPSFDAALARRDLPSALAIRLMFPSDDTGKLSIRRFLIDDHIEGSRDRVVRCISEESWVLAHALMGARRASPGQLPEDLAAKLTAFQEVLIHFPLRSVMQTLEPSVFASAKDLIRALLEWDVPAEVERLGDKSTERQDLPRPLVGLRNAAGLLQLYRDPNMQFHIMREALAGADNSTVSHFAQAIIDTNLEFAEAWKSLSKGEVALDEILSECDAAFAVHRLYRAAQSCHDRLPAPVVSFVSPLFKIGYQIRKTQEDFVAPQGSAIRVNKDDLRCLQSWQSGMIGNGMSDTRRRLMLSFLDGVRQLEGAIPRSAHSLIFESIAVFAEEFLAKAKQGLTDPVFVDGVSFVLSGFLISSPDMSPEHRLKMAEVLAVLFEMPQARVLSRDPQNLKQLSSDFHSLVGEARRGGLEGALRRLLRRTSVQALLVSFGLITSPASKSGA